MSENTLKMIQEHNVKWVDLRFTDSRGKEQHVTNSATIIDEEFFENGTMFDGSSIAGWKPIHESDMILMPDDSTPVMDPFIEETTLNLRCDIVEPTTLQGYERDPRSLAKRAETYLKSTGIGDTAFFGPEPEFFVFDDVKFGASISGAMYSINSEEAAWVSDADFEGGNLGHRPGIKGGYFPVPPVDSALDLRNAMCAAMESMGMTIDLHHHEVGTACQAEIGTRFQSLVRKADELQIYKYCVLNVAHAFGKTATFMPKPLVGDNGNGMHCHQSIAKDGVNVFAGDGYGNLSQEAMWYIGGIIKHGRVINAFSNPGTNSYKRLVPGFEAPLLLVYSARNRSAGIRIPFVQGGSPKGVRIEVRYGDPSANPYLMFAVMLMAGLDGIKNKIDPGDPLDKDLYDLPPEEIKDVPTVCSSLEQALGYLDRDRSFLTEGDVFNDSVIDGYIDLKMEEVTLLNSTTHPVEFDMYYSC
ncbi:MAG: type I glutamate--ammonia ligase [Pseudomonadales bacterium]|jgi:glutamine synthetase|nr:type I glutamate--ammonia ligase [Pseudomonadales bacterium]MDP7144414.1 type I glutamate--ammonia ligase [Pseudomonadales bacterium]MDP7358034.1 type I glutamate--ammonia ligase [Pseudomonadales bacterium]MDP7597503.1 type I glutamate--ammonia ligase [Pseudomonadales bacterium]HJN52541.1 type I glutamate--ammonia ligase [Pseudomonadales bacterium]